MLLFLTALSPLALADSSFQVTAQLTANDAVENLLFGSALAINGKTIAIGALGSRASGSRAPSTYIFYLDTSGLWSQHQELPHGGALSLQGGTLLAGDTVFVRNEAADFVEQAQLRPANSQPASGFGDAVALFDSGTRAAVGAPFATVDGAQAAGAVYIFDRDSSGHWTQTARLTAPTAAEFEDFGLAVAASGNTVLVGAPVSQNDTAAAYVFVDSGNGWTLQQTLSGPLGMGWSVALDGDTALISTDGGPAYVFVRDAGSHWTRQATLTPPKGTTGEFGLSVALSGDRALIGFPPSASTDTLTVPSGTGSAVVYTRTGTGAWSETATTGPYENSFDLGSAVALDADTLLVADPEAETTGQVSAGIVYVLQVPQQKAAEPTPGDSGGGSGAFGMLALLLSLPALIFRFRFKRK